MTTATHNLKNHKDQFHKVLVGESLLGTTRRQYSPLGLLKVSPNTSLSPSPLGSPSSENSQDVPDFHEITESKAKLLARDYIQYKINGVTELHDDVATTLRIMGDELMANHQTVVNAVAKRLRYSEAGSKNKEVFSLVANEIYKDGKENWGRIVSLYVLGAILAMNDLEESGGINTSAIIDYVGDFVEQKSLWIQKNGGWNGFVNFFNKAHKSDSTVWKGILCLASAAVVGYAASR